MVIRFRFREVDDVTQAVTGRCRYERGIVFTQMRKDEARKTLAPGWR